MRLAFVERLGSGGSQLSSSAGRVRVDHESVRRMRLRGRLPRYCVIATIGVLALAGARSAIFGSPPPKIERYIQAQTVDIGLESFAQDYARTYLTWNSEDPTAHQELLERFNSRLAADPATQPPRRLQSVASTQVAEDQPSAMGGRIVTVEATIAPTGQVVYLAVPVVRDSSGAMAVSAFPSFVGAPSSQTEAPHQVQRPVNDKELTTVVMRALTNYMAGDSANLAADLAPETQVTYPPNQLQVTDSQDQLTWTGPGGVLATVQAQDQQGASYTLSYEMGVERTDRWYVNSIEVIPTQ